MEKKTGGAAFPANAEYGPNGQWSTPYNEGMTLRDWFAGMALQGSLAGTPDSICTFDEYAHEAYQYADAMLKKRGEND